MNKSVLNAKRIAIIGYPGVGKSTFARKLSKKLSLPLEHLDMYYHDTTKPYYMAKDREQWLQKLEQIVHQPAWIIEGNYKSTFETRFKHADIVILLQFTRLTRVYRIFKRRWMYRKTAAARRQDMHHTWEEKVDWPFFKIVWNYDRVQLPIIKKLQMKQNHGITFCALHLRSSLRIFCLRLTKRMRIA